MVVNPFGRTERMTLGAREIGKNMWRVIRGVFKTGLCVTTHPALDSRRFHPVGDTRSHARTHTRVASLRNRSHPPRRAYLSIKHRP